MNVNISLPSITASAPAEQIAQIKSYLYQFVQQLDWALTSGLNNQFVPKAAYDTYVLETKQKIEELLQRIETLEKTTQ